MSQYIQSVGAGESLEELMMQSYSPPPPAPVPWATTTLPPGAKEAFIGIGVIGVAGLVLTGLLGYWLIKKL